MGRQPGQQTANGLCCRLRPRPLSSRCGRREAWTGTWLIDVRHRVRACARARGRRNDGRTVAWWREPPSVATERSHRAPCHAMPGHAMPGHAMPGHALLPCRPWMPRRPLPAARRPAPSCAALQVQGCACAALGLPAPRPPCPALPAPPACDGPAPRCGRGLAPKALRKQVLVPTKLDDWIG